MRPKLDPGSTKRVVTMQHAEERISDRVGPGFPPQWLASRAWETKEPVPGHWRFPRIGGCVYFRLGDCVFAFGSSWDGEKINCITAFGPFRPDGSWWDPELSKKKTT